MLINSLKTNTNPIYLKNHQTAGKTVNKPPQTVPIKNSVLYTPKPNELCSKFNISFRSRLDDDKKLDEFCLRLENKIKEMTTPKDPEIASWAMTPEYLDLINETFKKDNIGHIYKTGISANAMLNYLSRKEQVQLEGKDTAFVIDEMSLRFIEDSGANYFQNNSDEVKMKFYCLDTNEKETDKLIEEFNKLTNNSYEVKRIKRPENSDFSKLLDAKRIKAIIKVYASAKFKTEEEQNQFIDVITRYLDNNFLVFSYATLCEKLKEHYKLIEQEVKAQGKTMDDVVYIIPERNKSYDLINYLYAKTNNVPQEQFKDGSDIEETNADGSKIYVILDDLCASGHSIETNITDMYLPENLLFASVVSCKTGIENINGLINQLEFENTKLISGIEYKDLGYICDAINFHRCFRNEKFLINAMQYMRQFKDFNLNNVKFMLKNLKSGWQGMHTFINFPYMIPDNSSELNAFFGEYFLNNNSEEANKAAWNFEDIMLVHNEFERIKKDIENYYSNNP